MELIRILEQIRGNLQAEQAVFCQHPAAEARRHGCVQFRGVVAVADGHHCGDVDADTALVACTDLQGPLPDFAVAGIELQGAAAAIDANPVCRVRSGSDLFDAVNQAIQGCTACIPEPEVGIAEPAADFQGLGAVFVDGQRRLGVAGDGRCVVDVGDRNRHVGDGPPTWSIGCDHRQGVITDGRSRWHPGESAADAVDRQPSRQGVAHTSAIECLQAVCQGVVPSAAEQTLR